MDGGDAWTRFVGQLPHWLAVQVHHTDAAHDTLLAAMARGWPLERIARECGRDLEETRNPGAVVVARLRDLTQRWPVPEQPVKTKTWSQPLPWCGHCDDPRTRWEELPGGGVRRCSRCWTDPPRA